jgi:hypothetical protein
MVTKYSKTATTGQMTRRMKSPMLFRSRAGVDLKMLVNPNAVSAEIYVVARKNMPAIW